MSEEALFCEAFDAGAIAGGEGGGATWPARLLRLLPHPGPGGNEQTMRANSTGMHTHLPHGAVWDDAS